LPDLHSLAIFTSLVALIGLLLLAALEVVADYDHG
jgi:hypothetical protein